MRYRVLSVRTIAVWAVLIMAVGIGVAVWLLLAYADADANPAQLDAIRTAGTIVVGAGGAAALLLAARRQRTAEIALKQAEIALEQKDRDQADVARAHVLQVQVAEQTRRHQDRVAVATEADAAARRITDLYTKSVEQLGSEKAPVRLGGLYALERLAQDHVEQRQTIVNVLCAYLRMPCTLPGDPPAVDADDTVLASYRERVQEREVRLAAQRILTHHLHPGDDFDDPVDTFWPNTDLDLTDANLINFDIRRCSLRNTTFSRAIFTGTAWFDRATFTGTAEFNRATFTTTARFHQATFAGTAEFNRATFSSTTWFDQATFTGTAEFKRATFTAETWFTRVTFTGNAWFERATFTGNAAFSHATFTGNAWFRLATLPDTRYAGIDTMKPWTDFAGARFARGVPAEAAPFMALTKQ